MGDSQLILAVIMMVLGVLGFILGIINTVWLIKNDLPLLHIKPEGASMEKLRVMELYDSAKDENTVFEKPGIINIVTSEVSIFNRSRKTNNSVSVIESCNPQEFPLISNKISYTHMKDGASRTWFAPDRYWLSFLPCPIPAGEEERGFLCFELKNPATHIDFIVHDAFGKKYRGRIHASHLR